MENKTEKINQPKKCQEKRYDGSFCNRILYDEKHCVFHSENIEQKKDDFKKAFWKEFERQKKEDEYYDFKGFIFPDSISFEAKEFSKNVYFDEAQFKGYETCFEMTQFTGNETSFFRAKFTGNVTSFDETQFTGKMTLFIDVKFTGNTTSFFDAKFTSDVTHFSWTEFTGNVVYFSGAKFTCDVTLHRAIFKNVWGLFESLVKERKWLFLKIKRYLIKDWRFYLQEETANRHPLIKRLVNDAWYLDEFKLRYPIWYKIWKILADCGRSLQRWAAWSLGIALLFGVIFMYIGPESFELRHVPTKFSFFYYSIVTFTTLGFGDITPKTLTTEILVTIEVILGYIMLGGLISIFANKLARRS